MSRLPSFDEREFLRLPLLLSALGLLMLPLVMKAIQADLPGEGLVASLGLMISLTVAALMGGSIRLRVDDRGLLWSMGLLDLTRSRWRWDDIQQLRLEAGSPCTGAQLRGKNWRIGNGASSALWLGNGRGRELRISTDHAQRLHDHLLMKREALRHGQS